MDDSNGSNSSTNSNKEEVYEYVPDINKNDIINDKRFKNIQNERKKRNKEIKKILLKEFILFIIIILSIIKYKKSLKTIVQEEKDVDIDPSFFMELFYDCIKSSFYIILALFLIEFKICKVYQLSIIIIVYLLFFIFNRGQNIDGHGTMNALVFIATVFLGQIFIFILFFLRYIYNKNRVIVISLLFTFFISSIIIYKKKVEDQIKCKDWDIGLNNTKLDNNKNIYPCQMLYPNKRCFLNFLGPYLDFSRNKSCLKRNEEEKYKLKSISKSKYINEKTKRIGFPITTHRDNFNLNKQKNSKNLYNEIMNNLIDMDNKELLKKLGEKEKPEVVLDYTNNEYGEIHINLNYDDELAKERKQLEINTQPLYDNIIYIFFDAISRKHFSRVYKKTSQFINNFMKYEGYSNKKDPSQKYHGFQFFKQHSFKEFTLGNNIPMFYGKPYYNKKIESITGQLKDNGFITCNLNGICNKEAFYYDWQLKPNMERNYIEFDHEMFTLNCDPNYFDVENPHSVYMGESSIFRRCLYGKENIEYLFDYGIQFLENYKNNRKFLRISIPNGHEFTGQASKYIDEPLYIFLDYIFKNDLMKNSALILSADHGHSILVLYKFLQSLDQEIELYNPLLLFILSDNKTMSYEEQYGNIYKNQQNFITTYDIYHTLKDILYRDDKSISIKNINQKGEKFNPKKHFLGTSLFRYIDPKDRICSNYIDISDCICKIK